MWIKRFLPKSLLYRSLMIVVTPLVILQVISGLIFYESHWHKVSQQLSRNVAGDIATVIELIQQRPGLENRRATFDLAGAHMALIVSFREQAILPNAPHVVGGKMGFSLIKALDESVGRPFRIDTGSIDRMVIIDIQLTDGVLRVLTPRKRLFSTTTYVFVIWMVGSSLILFAVATVFMRNQVKPIRRLAEAADEFGKGRDVPKFKPEGASEVRLAATAFIAMRDRIARQISQRTEMLAGVSHDLRTPLTRMKLDLEMAGGGDEMKQDIAEMEHMLDEYLAFARGEGGETAVLSNLGDLLHSIAGQSRRKGGVIDLHVESDMTVLLRPNAIRRALTNLIDNSARFADHISVRAGRRDDRVEITIDDDGPGIPADKRDEVFKPFFRVEGSRNPGTGGVGLGMTIARDVMRAHGGDVELGDSPGGGLRARVVLPI